MVARTVHGMPRPTQLPTPSLSNLTPIQRRVARFVADFIRDHHFAPSAREVATVLNGAAVLSNAMGHLYRLERKGVIGRKHGVSRGMWIAEAWAPLFAAPERDATEPLDATTECEPAAVGELRTRGPLLKSESAQA